MFILISVFLLSEIKGPFRIYLGLVINAILGLSFIGITVPAQTLMQEATPKEMRGRVFGNYAFLGNITAILPVIFSGTIAELFGVKTLFAILGTLCAAAVLFSKIHGDRFLNPARAKARK